MSVQALLRRLMKDSPRKEILNKIARAIGKIELAHPVRVGIDGLSASGKTVFADELASVLQDEGKIVVRTGQDGFHNPPEIRHRQGPMSVEGYVEDSFDYSSVRENVLQPLGPGGDRRYAPEIFDHQMGEARTVEFKEAPEQGIPSLRGRNAIPQRTHRVFRFQDFGHVFAPGDSRACKSS